MLCGPSEVAFGSRRYKVISCCLKYLLEVHGMIEIGNMSNPLISSSICIIISAPPVFLVHKNEVEIVSNTELIMHLAVSWRQVVWADVQPI